MVGTTGWKRCLGAVVCAAVLALTGCGGLGLGGSGTPSASLAPTYDPDRPKPKAPKGYEWVHSPGAGVLIPVPKSWQPLAKDELLRGSDSAALEDAAATVGMSAADFAAYLKSVDAMAFGPPSKGFAPNVNSIAFDGELPSAKAIAAELETAGAKVGTAKTTKAAKIGKAVVVPYTLRAGSRTIHGRSLVIDGSTKVVTITVSHLTAKGADAVAAAILKNTVEF